MAAYAIAANEAARGPLGAAKPTASPDSVLLQDPLTSDIYGWSDVNAHCFFDPAGYHIINGYQCLSPAGFLADGRVTVTVEELIGASDQPYGVAFRFTPGDVEGQETYCYFAITSGGDWALFRSDNGSVTRLKDFTHDPAIRPGLAVKNTLRVEFRGPIITCWVNGVAVGAVSDPGSVMSPGRTGLEVGDPVNAVFTDFLVER